LADVSEPSVRSIFKGLMYEVYHTSSLLIWTWQRVPKRRQIKGARREPDVFESTVHLKNVRFPSVTLYQKQFQTNKVHDTRKIGH
jgi:hypothetical protein